MTGKRCVFFDIETTSAKVDEAEIIEIFALEMIDNAPTGKSFHRLVKPRSEIPPEVEKLTGLDKEQLKDKPSFKDIKHSLLEFIGDGDASKANKTVLGAHNFHFDGSILNRHLMSDEPKYELRTKYYLNAVSNDRKNSFATLEQDLKRLNGYKLADIDPNTIDTMRIVGQMGKVLHKMGPRSGQPKWPSLSESCDVLSVDVSERKQHGAAVDTMLSVECFLASEGYAADDKRRQETRDYCRPFFRGEENALPQPQLEPASREASADRSSNDTSGKRKAPWDEQPSGRRLRAKFDRQDRDISPGR